MDSNHTIEYLKTFGIIISILAIGVSIGMFKGKVNEVEAKQLEINKKVESFSDVYDRLTRIETILNERLPLNKNVQK